jgi:hypothetical protein
MDPVDGLAAVVLDAFRAGTKPSALIRMVYAEMPNGLSVVVVFRAAFGLSLAQCKMACDHWGRDGTPDGMDDHAMDAFLEPLIRRATK